MTYDSDTSWMTTEEWQAWVTLAFAATLIFELSVMHPADAEETCRDVHNLQNRLLARRSAVVKDKDV